MTILISTASGFVLLAAAATASAAIAGPIDSSGVIYGCFNTKANGVGGHPLVLQDVGTTCPPNTTAINWNQTGPAGPKGDTGATGATGATGPAGPKGDTGAAGPAGQAGPQGPKGDTGDTGPAGLQGPVGATGQQGPAGADGNTVLNGTGAPASNVGNTGDFYLDTAANVLYGPKSGSTGWPTTGTSLVGPAGPQGPAGPPGPSGATATYYVNTASEDVPPTSDSGDLNVACNSGDFATGGGFNSTSKSDTVIASGPRGNPPTGWFTHFYNNDLFYTDTFDVYVICVHP